MILNDFARFASRHGSTHPLTGNDPESTTGYDGPPAADDQQAALARLRAEEAAYIRARDSFRDAA